MGFVHFPVLGLVHCVKNTERLPSGSGNLSLFSDIDAQLLKRLQLVVEFTHEGNLRAFHKQPR